MWRQPWQLLGEVRLLSFFDGIGSAALALESLGMQLKTFLAWEVDEECNHLTKHHFPKVQHRGDFAKDDPRAVADLLNGDQTLVVITAGPPCPDFSRIRGPDAPGKAGPEGQKFTAFCKFINELRGLLRCPNTILVENVVFQQP